MFFLFSVLRNSCICSADMRRVITAIVRMGKEPGCEEIETTVSSMQKGERSAQIGRILGDAESLHIITSTNALDAPQT